MPDSINIVVISGFSPNHHQITGADGGSRTHTRGKPDWILSPARLPVPPHRHILSHKKMNYPLDTSLPLVVHYYEHSGVPPLAHADISRKHPRYILLHFMV